MPTSSGNYDNDIAALEADISNFNDELDNIREELDDTLTQVDDMLAAWEEKQETEQDEVTTDTDVKWYYDIDSNYTEEEVSIYYWQSPSQMNSDGDYTIRVTLTNYKTTAIDDLELSLIFTPRGTAYIDSKNTYLDTINRPYTLWDVDIRTHSTENYCQRITCISEEIHLDASTESTTTQLQLKLEFLLTYK